MPSMQVEGAARKFFVRWGDGVGSPCGYSLTKSDLDGFGNGVGRGVSVDEGRKAALSELLK